MTFGSTTPINLTHNAAHHPRPQPSSSLPRLVPCGSGPWFLPATKDAVQRRENGCELLGTVGSSWRMCFAVSMFQAETQKQGTGKQTVCRAATLEFPLSLSSLSPRRPAQLLPSEWLPQQQCQCQCQCETGGRVAVADCAADSLLPGAMTRWPAEFRSLACSRFNNSSNGRKAHGLSCPDEAVSPWCTV